MLHSPFLRDTVFVHMIYNSFGGMQKKASTTPIHLTAVPAQPQQPLTRHCPTAVENDHPSGETAVAAFSASYE